MAAIPGIEFHGIAGRGVESGGLLFFPALFDFVGRGEGPVGHELSGFLPEPLPLRELLGNDEDYPEALLTYWTRARIPLAFGFWPAVGWDDGREGVLDIPFLAVKLEPEIWLSRAIPVLCAEGRHGEPGLAFRLDEDPEVIQWVAKAFWSVLLRAPQEVAGFEELLFDCEGGCSVVEFRDGRLTVGSMDEEDEYDGPPEGYAPHVTTFRGERFRCPDCEGSGIEDHEFYTDDCASCGGTGQVTW